MSTDQYLTIFRLYDKKIDEVLKTSAWHYDNAGVHQDMSRLKGMISEMVLFLVLEERQTEKLNHWLGFIQGVFYTHGIYTFDELKQHNRLHENQNQKETN